MKPNKNKCREILALMLAFLLASPVLANDNTERIEGVAAVVNDQVISLSDVRNRVRLILLGMNVEADENRFAQARPYALRALIDEHLQIQEAANFKIGATEEELNQKVENLARRNGLNTEIFLADLAAKHINPSTLRQQIQAQIVWQKLIGGLYGQRVRISQLQIDGMLERMARSLEQERFHVAEILLAANTPEQKQKARLQAQKLRQQIAAETISFPLAAQQFSSSSSASSGGELGWVQRDSLQPEIRIALEKMSPPSLSNPVETNKGIYLIALIEKKDPLSEQDEVLHLGQIASFDKNSAAKINAARKLYHECNDLAAADNSNNQIILSDLGNVQLDTLSEPVQKAVSSTKTGQWTNLIPIPGGAVSMLVCNRMTSMESSLPDRQTVEDSLFETHLERLSSRYLRNLRREAAIVQPNSIENFPVTFPG